MKEHIFIPPLKIQGIKTKLLPSIKNNVLLDKTCVWIEPFMGSGVVGFNLAPKKAIFADTNPCIISFYNAIKDGKITSSLVRTFLEKEGKKLFEKDSEYYYEVRERFNKHQDPLDFLFLNRSCFNGVMRFNKLNHFNVPYGHKPQRFSKAYITKIVNQVSHIENLIKTNDWFFLCQSFEKTITEAPSHAFIYCDPPYIGRHVDYYDSWDEKSEILLKEVLVASNKNFMVSTWDFNLYRKNIYLDTIWSFCEKINIQHFYHIGAKESNRNPITEALLTNYKPKNYTQLDNPPQQLSFFNNI